MQRVEYFKKEVGIKLKQQINEFIDSEKYKLIKVKYFLHQMPQNKEKYSAFVTYDEIYIDDKRVVPKFDGPSTTDNSGMS